MNALRHPAAHRLLAVLLGAVFVFASYDKILQPAEFARIVYHYRLLGPSAAIGPLPANLLAVTLPWLELVTGLLLLAGLWRREAALTAGGMLVAFLIAVGYATAQGIDVGNCGCFSVGGEAGEGRSVGWTLFFGDLGLLGAAAVVAFLPPRQAETASAEEELAATG